VTPTPKLNDTQLAVLRWIADGSPAGVMKGHGHPVSAAALRTRELIKISGRSSTWRARLTPAGEAVLGIERQAGTIAPVRRSGARAGRKPSRGAAGRNTQRIAVPRDLRGAHPLVTATRNAAVGAHAGADGRIRIGPRRGIAHMEVSRPLVRRALLVLHGVTREARKRGW
jgi:hypothetical protein